MSSTCENNLTFKLLFLSASAAVFVLAAFAVVDAVVAFAADIVVNGSHAGGCGGGGGTGFVS